MLKRTILLLFIVAGSLMGRAQVVDSIFVNLYTDSLKKGTYNYINIDGKTNKGNWLPLDSNHLIFTSSAGKFSGNSLWIDRDFTGKVHIKVVMKKDPSVSKEFDIWVKTKEDDEKLKTNEEVMRDLKSKSKSKN